MQKQALFSLFPVIAQQKRRIFFKYTHTHTNNAKLSMPSTTLPTGSPLARIPQYGGNEPTAMQIDISSGEEENEESSEDELATAFAATPLAQAIQKQSSKKRTLE